MSITRIGGKAEVDEILDLAARGLGARVTLRAVTMAPSLPQRPIARPPCALMAPTICLLIEPASTISTISTVALSVTVRRS